MESQEIIEFAKKFIDEHWSEINKERCEILESPIMLKKEIETKIGMASWVITEVMSWGCKTNYLNFYLRDSINSKDEEINVYYIENKYYRNIDYVLTEVFPKTKKVIYFD